MPNRRRTDLFAPKSSYNHKSLKLWLIFAVLCIAGTRHRVAGVKERRDCPKRLSSGCDGAEEDG